MKKLYTHLLAIAGLTVMSVGFCNAQSGTLALKAPSAAIVIDGSSAEWGDSLSYYHPDTKIHYAIANDKTNLYLIVKTKDPAQENNIIRNGLTFSIDAKGRKKRTFSTTFPTPVNSAYGGGGVKPGESLEEKRLRAATFKFRKITVDGFRDVNEESINSTNDFGISTMIGYDNDGSLVYEEVIPLQLFHAESLAKGEWAFNIKLNGHEASSDNPGSGAAPADMSAASGGGRGGRGGGGAPKRIDQSAANAFFANAHTSTPAIDFWGKFTLAQ